MGLMDKVKAQATQLADKAQQAGQAGQAKLADLQAKRKGDALLLELGGIVYSQKVGRADAGAETRIAELVARLQAYEAEHGPGPVTSADAARRRRRARRRACPTSRVPPRPRRPAPAAPPPAASAGPDSPGPVRFGAELSRRVAVATTAEGPSRGSGPMAWDFTTEPEFQEKLDWMDAFVRDEVEPLDLVWGGKAFHPLDDTLRKVVDPLKQQVRDQGLWACHLGPELGRRGIRPAEALAHERDPGPEPVGAHHLRDPGPRHRQRRDHRPLRDRGAEGALPAAAARTARSSRRTR